MPPEKVLGPEKLIAPVLVPDATAPEVTVKPP
jgi:hypothetical protein